MGRPTKLTTPVYDNILKALSVGSSRRAAAGACGIDEKTMSSWMHRGSKPGAKGLYAEFAGAVREAEEKAALRMEMTVFEAGRVSPNIALKWLERRRPADWADQSMVRLGNAQGEDLRIVVSLSGPKPAEDGDANDHD